MIYRGPILRECTSRREVMSEVRETVQHGSATTSAWKRTTCRSEMGGGRGGLGMRLPRTVRAQGGAMLGGRGGG